MCTNDGPQATVFLYEFAPVSQNIWILTHLHILTDALPTCTYTNMWFKHRISPENSSTFVHVLNLIGVYTINSSII